MHYSASITQLVATIIMTVLRVAIRRHISQEPQKNIHTTENEVRTVVSDSQRSNEFELTPTSGPRHEIQEQRHGRYTVQELTDGHELDIIAMQLQNCKLWQVAAFWGPDEATGRSTSTSTGKLAENVLTTRIRLTTLLQSPWHTKIGEQAKVLSDTMAEVMNSLWNSEGISGSMPKLTEDFASMDNLRWKIPIKVQPNTSNGLESISISLSREQLADDKWKPWEADITRVEAVLHLWMLGLNSYTTGGDGNVLWLLCPDDDYKATMIADWWIGRETGSVSDKALDDICKEYNISSLPGGQWGPSTSATGVDIRNCLIGYIGLAIDPETSLPSPSPVVNKGKKITRAVIQNMALGTFAAQYILYTFLAHLVHSIDKVTTPTVVRDEQATGPLLRNDTITDLALKVQERGLCTVTEAYRMVLCAFTANGKLPVPYRQSADPFLVLYHHALELGYKYHGENDKSSPAALRAEKIYEEALRLCRFEAMELIGHKKWADAGALVVRAARISESFSIEGVEHMKEMKDLMLWVGGKFVSNSVLEGVTAAASVDTADNTPLGVAGAPRAPGATPPTDSSPELISVPSKLVTAVCSHDANEVQKLLLAAVNDNSTESSMDKAHALDHAAQRGNKEILILLHLYGALSSNAPLWWAIDGTCMRNSNKVTIEDDSVGIESDCVEVLKLLLDFGHDPNKLDLKAEESPLHLTAKLNLMKAMGALLAKVEPPSTRSLASVDLQDQNGLSPLYYAAMEGHGSMATLLVNHGANINGGDGLYKKSPMHYAASRGGREVLRILHENGGDIKAFDSEGKCPLYYAAKGGSKEVVETLLELGADINRKCPQSQGGRTALHWMAIEGNADAIRLLLENQVSLGEGDEAGKTALHHAAKEGQRAAVYVLLEKGASLDTKDTAGNIPMVYAKELPDGEVANDIIWMLDHSNGIKLDDQKWTALHRAASKSRGDEVAAEILLRCGADVEAMGATGSTAIHLAASNGYERMVQMLLDNEAAVNTLNNKLWTPLHKAADKGHEQIVQMLLDKEAEVGIRDDKGWTPLHRAANKGHDQIVQMLLGKEAEVGIRDVAGWTPLHQAASKGHECIVQMLLDKGAEVNVKDNKKCTPLHQAANKGHEQIVQMLLDKGAGVGIRGDIGWTPLHQAASKGHEQIVQMLLDKEAEVNVKDDEEWTPLHRAAHSGYERLVQMLLDKEAEVNVKDNKECTPLHQAASNGHERIVQMLLDKGAEVNVKDNEEWTPLHHSTSNGHERIVQILLAKEAEVNVEDDEEWTPLHRAAYNGYELVVQMLLDKEAEVNVEDNEEWTPLHRAAYNGYERVVQMLLGKDAKVNVKDNDGWTPLHQAANKGHEQIVQMLLDKEAEVGIRDDKGWTPLHHAAQNGHVEAIRALLHRGADIMTSTNRGYTPLHIAVRGQHPQVIQLLVGNGATLHSTDSQGNTPESYVTQPFEGIEINPEVAEVFRALRNRNADGAITKDGGS